MTLAQLLDALTVCAAQYRWTVDAHSQLRGDAWGLVVDPVTAVAYAHIPCFFPVADAGQAAAYLGLGPQDWYALRRASDGQGDELLREALERAVGLQVETRTGWDAALAALPRARGEA